MRRENKNYSNKCDDFLLSLMGESLSLMESYSSMSFIKFSVIKFPLLYMYVSFIEWEEMRMK